MYDAFTRIRELGLETCANKKKTIKNLYPRKLTQTLYQSCHTKSKKQ